MPGPFYTAWVGPDETVFLPEHVREDESVYSFDLSQSEGDFALLRLEVRNPRVGLLGPGREQWMWFSWDRASFDGSSGGPDVVPLFFGRLVGIPSNLFQDLITLDFVARPVDYVDQKELLAAALRSLPHYEPAFLDTQRRLDPDVVLEARSALWHVGRTDHVVSISDIIEGEDGVEVFTEDDIYEMKSMQLLSVPLTKVRVSAKLSWTQRVGGTVDLTDYIVSRFPTLKLGWRAIRSVYDLEALWPKTSAGLGDGWIAALGYAIPTNTYEVQTASHSSVIPIKHSSGGGNFSSSSSIAYVVNHLGWPLFPVNNLGKRWSPETFPPEKSNILNGLAEYQVSREFSEELSITQNDSRDDEGQLQSTSNSSNWGESQQWAINYQVRLVAGIDPSVSRKQNELVSLTLEADVQSVVTLPEDADEATIDLNSVDLADALGEDSDSASDPPLNSPSTRVYLTTSRGLQTLQHMVLLARARLLSAARAIEITADVPFDRLPDISLRKSAQVIDPRLPGGTAEGKVVSYRASLSGDEGKLQLEVTIGCAIGKDGTISAIAGQPTWAEEAYAGNDYQEYTGKQVVIETGKSDVGFTVPLANPQDDGINFGVGLSPFSILRSPITVPSVNPPVVRFSLKPLSGEFESPYEVDVTQLKIPKLIDLEAA